MARGSARGQDRSVHTTPSPSGPGWINQSNGEVLSEHRLKTSAVEAGRQEAQQRHVEHVIHNANGKIGAKNSYGNDPRRRKG